MNYLVGKPKETIDHTVGPSELMLQFMRAIGRGEFEGKGDVIDAIALEDHSDDAN